jgi:ankyrin repeat protein
MIIKAFPNDLKTEGNDGNLLLHWACKRNLPPKVLNILIENFPESIKIDNKDGELPHDMASDSKLKIILRAAKLLFQACPEAVKKKGALGLFPLHYVLGFNSTTADMETIIKACADAEKVQVIDGNLPPYWACKRSFSPEVLKMLCDFYPESIYCKNKSSELPQDLASESDKQNFLRAAKLLFIE